jgi:LacI family transcriptional regulator
MQGVLEAVRDKGDQLLLEVCDQRFVDHRLWRDLFAGKRVDGLLIATPYLDQGYLQDLHDQRSPVVLINGERPDLPGLDYVGYDDFACGVDATNYLIGLGHRRIAHVAGNMNQQSACRRLEGYRHAMAAAGLAVLDDDVVYGDYLPLEGRDAARPLFERPEAERPTALFCANDTMALAIVEHQASKGLFVPRDFSVAGVDDTGAAAQATPALTTFRQDVFALSYKAADLFLQKLYSPGSPPLQHRTKMQLIERASCGRPKA